MRRRPDRTDALLEAWAGWRVSYELYCGTGDSAIARFSDPASTRHSGARVLWTGRIHSHLAGLDSALVCYLGTHHCTLLAYLYGTPGTDALKSQHLNTCCRTLSRLRHKARTVAAAFVPEPRHPNWRLNHDHVQERTS